MGQSQGKVSIENLSSVPDDPAEVRASVTSLVKILSSSGCDARLVEEAAAGALEALGVANTVIEVAPSRVLFVGERETWGTTAVKSRVSITRAELSARPLLRVGGHPGRYNSTYLAAHAARLKDLPPLYPLWLQFIAWVLLSPACTVVFHYGSWPNVLLTFIASIFTFLTAALLPLFFPKVLFASGFMAGFVAGFIAKIAASIGLLAAGCVQGVTVSAIIAIVPGAGITYGILDITQGNLVCGTSRLVGALVQSSLQGLGIVAGWYVGAWYHYPAAVVATPMPCPDPVSRWFLFLFIPLVWFGWCTLLECKLKRWPLYCVASFISQLYGAFLPDTLPSFTVALLSSLTVGIYGAIYSRCTGKPAFGLVLVGIYSLLPGGGAVWNAVAGIADLPVQPSSILQIAVQIAAGLSLANVFYTKVECRKTVPRSERTRRTFMR
jgi:uncharacterized membrane protein YjjP (DUF1212 family)